jgi:hypothetical protein
MATRKKQRRTNPHRDEIPGWGADFMNDFGGVPAEKATMRMKMNKLEISTEFPGLSFQDIMMTGASVITIFKDEMESLHFIRGKGEVKNPETQVFEETQFLKMPGGKFQGSQMTDELFEQSLRIMACGTGGKDKGFGYSQEVFDAYLKKIKWHRASENQLSLENALKRTAIYEHLEETGMLISELEFCSVIYKRKNGSFIQKYPNFFFKVKEAYVQNPMGDLSQITTLKSDMRSSPFSKGSVVAMCVPRHASTASTQITSPAHLLALETCLGEKLV